MGAAGFIARWIGEKAMGIVKVPVKDGVMFPYIWKYADKIKDLQTETQKVSETYINDLMEEAMNKHDFVGLKVIYNYVKHQNYKTDDLLQKVIWYGRELRLEHWMKGKFGDPFAMIDTITRHLS